MRRPVVLLCIIPKTGRVHRYVDRKCRETACMKSCPPEELLGALNHFRTVGLPMPEERPA